MLAIDSLVLDLIFPADSDLEQTAVLDALGGEEFIATRQLVDPDMQDPRWELELTPSMPFRRRGERRLLLIDASVAPMRPDPRTDTVAKIDLRPEKERLIGLCEDLGLRAGRLSGLGVWGSAVLVAKSAVDLRALCLISWALDPSVDIEGRRRATPLARQEFEEKLMAFEKRLAELDEKQILANIGPSKLERRGDYLVLDVLDGEGHWDLLHSLEMEAAIAATDRFSVIIGAPQGKQASPPRGDAPANSESTKGENRPANGVKPEPAVPVAPPSDSRPPLGITEHDGDLLLLFPRERFDLEIAAAIGKKDWDSVLANQDKLTGKQRDTLHRSGGGFVAPLEFLSEVFIEGLPLTRNVFAEQSSIDDDGTRTLEVHCPRFGQVRLIDFADASNKPNQSARFITSLAADEPMKETIRQHYQD